MWVTVERGVWVTVERGSVGDSGGPGVMSNYTHTLA